MLEMLQIYAWSGGLEIGITKCDPECTEIPANATDLKNGTWVIIQAINFYHKNMLFSCQIINSIQILSGSSVLKDGRSVLDIYGLNLNTIDEGDVVGILRTDQDELLFSINGVCKGIAAYHIPCRVFAVIDLYGQVAQASVVSYAPVENIQFSTISSELDTCKW